MASCEIRTWEQLVPDIYWSRPIIDSCPGMFDETDRWDRDTPLDCEALDKVLRMNYNTWTLRWKERMRSKEENIFEVSSLEYNRTDIEDRY